MLIKTDNSQQVWQSADGEVTIWEIDIVTSQGKKGSVRTYVKEIAERGYEGDVSWFKDDKGRTYVKPSEDTFTPKAAKAHDRGTEIRAQFAIKTAVEFLKRDDPEFECSASTIEHWAVVFFNMIDTVADKGGTHE